VDSEVSPLTQEYVDTLTRGIPWGRAGTPRDIAEAALFLASPHADYVTGEVLGVNGGAMAGRSHLPLSTPGAARPAAAARKENAR
jgi:NAD(P)-dependent dehydrogenase (short-subunit alcohol dehydrogenase family)